MYPGSVALKGVVEVEDLVAGWQLVTGLLRPTGFAICQHIDAQVAGFTYIVYQPHAHREGGAKYLFADASRHHPTSAEGLEDFGSVGDGACRRATEAGAVRFVITTIGQDVERLDAERLLLLARLNVAEDPRFWKPAHTTANRMQSPPASANAPAGRARLAS